MHKVSFFVVGGTRCNDLSFTLKYVPIYINTSDYGTLKICLHVSPWFSTGFISYPMEHMCLTKSSNAPAIFLFISSN